MGEYATRWDTGKRIKIGTCESMYYLRADQASLVQAERTSVDPIRDAKQLRFRFPFPDEDWIAPGSFDDYDRAYRIDGLTPPTGEGWSHYSVQFICKSKGYNVCLPCPESGENSHGLTVHRNGFRGAVFLSQQVYDSGHLVPVLSCACGMAWRLRTVEDCADLLGALDTMHREHVRWQELPDGAPTAMRAIADRITLGFNREYVASLGFAAQRGAVA